MGGETDLQHTTQQGHNHETLHNKRQFSWYNIFMVATMSWGAFGYGYTNAVIGPTLGIFFFSFSFLSRVLLSGVYMYLS